MLLSGAYLLTTGERCYMKRKAKPWEHVIYVNGSNQFGWFWFIGCLAGNYTIQSELDYETRSGARRAARRVLDRLNLVEAKP